MVDPLVLGYARAHASEFAALLARHPFEEGIEVLQGLPDADALAVLAVLPGSQLRRVLEALGDEDVAGLLGHADFELAVALLQRLRPERRTAMLARLPSRRFRLDLERRLAWEDGSLGALASRHFAAVPAGATLDELIQEMRELEAGGDPDPDLFVLDDGGRLRGEVDLRKALEVADRSTPVLRCLLPLQSLPADMPARVAVELPLWRRCTSVPVVDRGQRLLGTVTLATLRDSTHVAADAHDTFSILTDLARHFMEILSSLLGLLFGGGASSGRRDS